VSHRPNAEVPVSPMTMSPGRMKDPSDYQTISISGEIVGSEREITYGPEKVLFECIAWGEILGRELIPCNLF